MHDDAADIKREADGLQLIFSMLVSPVQGERVAAREGWSACSAQAADIRATSGLSRPPG